METEKEVDQKLPVLHVSPGQNMLPHFVIIVKAFANRKLLYSTGYGTLAYAYNYLIKTCQQYLVFISINLNTKKI